MTKDEAIKFWGGPTRLAKALGITRDAVHKWKKYPPIDKQFQIMVLSGGRLSVTYINEKGQNNNDE
jgi:3-methyladenine DNA glycosylase Mpg